MRKYIKNKLIQLLNSASNLDELAWKSICAGDAGAFIDALTNNQNIAIKIGQVIESTVGEGTKTVDILEKYCEQIFDISQTGDKTQLGLKLRELSQLREQIVYSLEKDIPTRYEIVFLPYMASMWDSLESVWKSANDDDLCDVYVVALPYYEKDKHGNLTSMVYEGDKYPDYVPITDYRSYDIVGRHPDIIYFHNPYDEYNSATSIPPKYYACELRNYTDMLVYIPYFVGINGQVQRHLCALPGAMYSNKVIVESESVRQIYIDELHRFEIEKNCKGLMGDIEEKVVALGSPKFDKGQQKQSDDYELPKEWERYIYREDGSKKRIVLYNTTIMALLNTPDILEKIKSTISTMSTNKEVVMWWRPHPLYESTMRRERPEIYSEYRNIVEEYIRNGNGIFDATSDLARAVALSDAYYGDGSSVATLFKEAGKPVLLQEPKIYKMGEAGKDETTVLFRNIVDFEYGSIGVSETFNGVFLLDHAGYNIKYLCKIPDEKLFGGSLYCDVVCNDDELVFIPFCAKDIAILNTKTMAISKYALPDKECDVQWRFSSVCRYGNKLFLIPGKYDDIISFDLNTHEVNSVIAWKEIISNDICCNKDILLSVCALGVRGSRAYIQFIHTNILLVFNMEKEQFEDKIYLPRGNYDISAAYKDDIWVIPSDNGSILRVSTVDSSITEVCKNPLKIENELAYCTSKVIFNNEKMYMFPKGSTRIGVIDIRTGESYADCAVMDKLYNEIGEYPTFICVKEFANNMVLASIYYKKKNVCQNIKIDLKNMNVEVLKLKGENSWIREYMTDCVNGKDKEICNENRITKLSRENPLVLYLEYLKNMNSICLTEKKKIIGEVIHSYVRS